MKSTKGSACPVERGEEEILLRYCAGTLAAEGAAQLEGHITSCSRCRMWVQEQQMVWRTLESWELEPVTADFDAALLARIAREKEARPGWRGWWERAVGAWSGGLEWRVAVPAAALALLLAAGLAVTNPFRGEPVETAVRLEAREIEQAERALEDLEMLRQLEPPEEDKKL